MSRVLRIVLALAALWAAAAGAKSDPSEKLRTLYAQLLLRHRPDLAARWGATSDELIPFAPLSESSLPGHVRSLEWLQREAGKLPAHARADTLRARLAFELAQCAPEGALRRDAFVWLDMVEAAVRVPFAPGAPGGCKQVQRATDQLRQVPDALRSGALLMRGAPGPDRDSLERRLTELEQWFRESLPARTGACKEARRLADFVEADTLAAASLTDFRHRLLPAP